MDNIARELGMSKKTLYDHFNNKADLLAKALQMVITEINSWYDELKQRELSAIDELLEISKRVNDEYDKFTPSNIFDLKKYYPVVIMEHFEKEKKLTYKVLVENLQKGIAQGFYRSDLDVELIAMLYVQKIEALHSGGFWEDADVRFEKVFEIMFENHIRGIVNQSGLAYFETCKSHLNFEK
jgi:TetR/AcrR family transcriptional regulator, cholesterol catabolism regulator